MKDDHSWMSFFLKKKADNCYNYELELFNIKNIDTIHICRLNKPIKY